jgi:hypothetical protein
MYEESNEEGKRIATKEVLCIFSRPNGRRPRSLSSQRHTNTVQMVLLAYELLCRNHKSVQAQDDTERSRTTDRKTPTDIYISLYRDCNTKDTHTDTVHSRACRSSTYAVSHSRRLPRVE